MKPTRPMISAITACRLYQAACLALVCAYHFSAAASEALTKPDRNTTSRRHASGRSSHSHRSTAGNRTTSGSASRSHTGSRHRHRHGAAESPAPAVEKHSAGKHHLTSKHAAAEGPVVEPSGYGDQVKIYSLYDQGVNARLLGDYHTAVSRLAEAVEMLKESHLSPTLETMAEFELGQAAEADSQTKVAINAYSRCVYLSPRYTNAASKLASLLLRSGQPALALVRARDSAQRNPNDAGAHLVLSLVLEKNGFTRDAEIERERSTQLLSGIGKVSEPAPRIEAAPGTQPGIPSDEPAPENGTSSGSAPQPGNENETPNNDSSSPKAGGTTSGSPSVPDTSTVPSVKATPAVAPTEPTAPTAPTVEPKSDSP